LFSRVVRLEDTQALAMESAVGAPGTVERAADPGRLRNARASAHVFEAEKGQRHGERVFEALEWLVERLLERVAAERVPGSVDVYKAPDACSLALALSDVTAEILCVR